MELTLIWSVITENIETTDIIDKIINYINKNDDTFTNLEYETNIWKNNDFLNLFKEKGRYYPFLNSNMEYFNYYYVELKNDNIIIKIIFARTNENFNIDNFVLDIINIDKDETKLLNTMILRDIQIKNGEVFNLYDMNIEKCKERYNKRILKLPNGKNFNYNDRVFF